MPHIGLLPIAEKIADALFSANSEHKKNSYLEKRRSFIAAALPLLSEAVEIGIDQAIIAVDERRKTIVADGK